MYEKFYGLKEKPFSLVPNSRFLYPSKKHQNALTYLEYGLSEGAGFIVLTGEIGSGKTTTLQHILRRLEGDVEVAVISNTNVNSDELISLVAHEFEIEGEFSSKAKKLDAVFHYLIGQYAQGKRVLLVVDEAQNLPIHALEEVRMLSNLQTEDQSLLQIMLIGQPQLREKLQRPELTQLSQRVAVYYHLGALDRGELEEYLAFRLEKVGGKLDIFEPATFELIYEASGGIPRVINLLCDTALVYGYADSASRISKDIIAQVIRDKEGFGLRVSSQEEQPSAGSCGTSGVSAKRIDTLEQQVRDLRQQFDQLLLSVAQKNNSINERLIIELFSLLHKEGGAETSCISPNCTKEEGKDTSKFFSRKQKNHSPFNESDSREKSTSPIASPHQEQTQKTWPAKGSSGDSQLTMIDLNCRILPDDEHGTRSFDQSLTMARLAVSDGVGVMVATPYVQDTSSASVDISRGVSWLNHLLRQERIALTVMSGAEISTSISPADVKDLTINDTDYLLLEVPTTPLPSNFKEILAQYVAAGLRPILTHPERNPTVICSPEALQTFLPQDCFVQVAAGSLLGDFGPEIKHCSHQLLRAGRVAVMASESYSLSKPKALLEQGVQCASEIIGTEEAQKLVFSSPAKIIAGLAL